MEVDDLDFMELLPVLGDELGDDDENFTLSQIADRIELDYIKSECMISNFADMTFDLGYQSESGETGPSHSNMEVTTIQDTCTLSENSLRFGNPVKDEDLDELISGTTPANTKKSTAWAVRVFNDWRISRNTALENIPNLDHFSVDDINRWLSRFIVEVRSHENYSFVSDVSKSTSFLNVTVQYILQKYPKPWNSETMKLVAFLYGVMSHQVANYLWYGEDIQQGFLNMMTKLNFHGNFTEVAFYAELGSDVVLAYDLNLDHVRPFLECIT